MWELGKVGFPTFPRRGKNSVASRAVSGRDLAGKKVHASEDDVLQDDDSEEEEVVVHNRQPEEETVS